MAESTDRWYPDVGDVVLVHERVASQYPETSAGVRDRGMVEYVVESVREGLATESDESIHKDAFQLARLLVANHSFVDGNKRTALAVVTAFYLLNGHRFDYDHDVRTILKSFGTNESEVNESEVLSYLRDHTRPVDMESETDDWRDDLVEYGLQRLGEQNGSHRNG